MEKASICEGTFGDCFLDRTVLSIHIHSTPFVVFLCLYPQHVCKHHPTIRGSDGRKSVRTTSTLGIIYYPLLFPFMEFCSHRNRLQNRQQNAYVSHGRFCICWVSTSVIPTYLIEELKWNPNGKSWWLVFGRWEAKLESAGLMLGLLGNICLAFLFFPVTRSSSVMRVIGLTSESSVKYHIWLGHITMTLFTAHGFSYIIFWASTNQISEVQRPPSEAYAN